MKLRHLAVLGASLLLAGCGPKVPLNTGLAERPVDVIFGSQHHGAPTSSPSLPPFILNAIPNFPAAIGPPPLPVGQAVATGGPPPPCPEANVFAVPELSALSTPNHRPAVAVYPFHYGATETNTVQGSVQTRKLPESGTRAVHDVSPLATDGSFTFQLTETYDSWITTFGYHVIPTAPVSQEQPPGEPGSVPYPFGIPGPQPLPSPIVSPMPQQAAPSETPGLYLTHMDVKSTSPNSPYGPGTFTPTPEILVMPYPAQPGVQFAASGTDGASATTMEIDPNGGGAIVGLNRVDACGTMLASWRTEIKGKITNARGGPSSPTVFDLTFDDATQYGGIPIAYHLVQTQTDQVSGQTISYDITGTISTKPQNTQN